MKKNTLQNLQKAVSYALFGLLFSTFLMCARKETSPQPKHQLAFEANGGSATPVQTVPTGNKAAKPTDPTKQDAAFGGWFTDDKTFSKPFDFNTPINANITLYAKWVELYATIPDTNFRSFLKKTYPDAFVGDKMSTQHPSVLQATEIDVRNKNIADLTGIEYFVALTKLVCYGNQLTVLDVSKNTALTRFYCYYNKLTALDISKNHNLLFIRSKLNPNPALVTLKLQDKDKCSPVIKLLFDENKTTLEMVITTYNPDGTQNAVLDEATYQSSCP